MTIATPTLIADLTARTKENLEAVQQFENLIDHALNYKVSAESWSILECIEHLNRYGDFYLPEIGYRLTSAPKGAANPTFKSGWLGNYFAESMLPKEKLNKMKTFKEMNPAGSQLSRGVLSKFCEQQRELLKLLQGAAKVDLSRVKTSISISKLIKLRLGDTLRIVIYHNQRHLVQAKKVLSQVALRADNARLAG